MRVKRAFSSDLLGMTSSTEQAYLEVYGKHLYAGIGEVVDLGCWLGSTTIPLVRGLLENPRFVGSGRKVYAYDLFIWFDWMNSSIAGTELFGKYVEGDPFVDEFEKRTASFSDSIETRAGDLKLIGWNDGGVEFLLIDAMKNFELASSIVRDFYPHLVAGTSLVFHQDFAHYFTPWVHLIQWKFRDHFEFVEDIPRSTSVVFKCTRRISEIDCSPDLSFAAFNDSDVNAAFDYSFSVVSGEKLSNVAAAKVMWYLHQNETEKAEALFADLISNGVALENDMVLVQQLLSERLCAT
jgi:hypothetical protein